MMERKGLAVTSVLTALPLPIIVTVLMTTIRINSLEPQYDFHQYALQSIGLFLLLIFLAPVTTIISGLTGYVAFRQSQLLARKLAIGSFVITAIGIVLLIIFIAMMQSAGSSTTEVMPV